MVLKTKISVSFSIFSATADGRLKVSFCRLKLLFCGINNPKW